MPGPQQVVEKLFSNECTFAYCMKEKVTGGGKLTGPRLTKGVTGTWKAEWLKPTKKKFIHLFYLFYHPNSCFRGMYHKDGRKV